MVACLEGIEHRASRSGCGNPGCTATAVGGAEQLDSAHTLDSTFQELIWIGDLLLLAVLLAGCLALFSLALLPLAASQV